MRVGTLLFVTLGLFPVLTTAAERFTARAKVISVEPEYEWVREPVDRPRCRRSEFPDEAFVDDGWDDEDEEILPMILGGAIGGALGHQVGGGRGKDVATVAGAIAGTLVAHDWAEERHMRPRRCRPHRRWVERRRAVGYLVTYRYAGRTFTTHTDHHPGRWIDLRVRLEPLE